MSLFDFTLPLLFLLGVALAWVGILLIVTSLTNR